MRAVLVAFLLSLLVGCGGGEKPAETKGADKTAAKDGSAASATVKTDGEKQVVTYQTGDQKMTVESDGKTMVIKSADGKETTVNVGAAQKLGETMAATADKEVAAATEDAAQAGEATEASAASEASESSSAQAMTIKTGEASMTFGGTNVPKDFPLPLYKDAKVEYSAHIEPTADNKEENYQIHLTSKDPAETVAKFYEAELKKKGLEVNRIDQKFNGMEIITLACESQKDNVSATAQAQRDADSDTTRIILTWTNQK